MDREQIRSQVQQLLREYLADRVTSSQALTKRFHYLFERLSITLTRLICQLAKEFSQSQFEPVAFELPIRQGGADRAAGAANRRRDQRLCGGRGGPCGLDGSRRQAVCAGGRL